MGTNGNIQETLRGLARDSGLTHRQLAEFSGCTRAMVTLWMHRRVNMRLHRLDGMLAGIGRQLEFRVAKLEAESTKTAGKNPLGA